MSEQMKTAGEPLGQDVVSEDVESAVGEVAANQGVAAAGNAEAAAAGVDETLEGEAADEPTEEELAAARELAENNALADVFDDVRKQSADSHLVTPERWPEIGLVPEHMTAEDFEMFVYEWLEDYQAEHKDEIEAERAAERAKAAAVRSATRAVGVPPKIPNRRLAQIEADNEAKAAEAADKAPKAVGDSAEAESAAGVNASVQVDNAAESAESAAVAATPAVSEPAPGSPDSAAEDEQPAEDDRSPFAGLRIPEGYRLEQIEGEWVLVEDENAAPVRKEIKCNRIKVLMGMHSYYLYDETLMTASYARWAFLAAEDNPVVTFVECVREDSRVYPRPYAAECLKNPPFRMTDEQIEETWQAVRDSGNYPDIERTEASNGDVYYYSTQYLESGYAASLAEYDAVERPADV
ncbi:hypothetical protein ET524_04690 [Senegalimassilia faecalis]|uniref:Uncharacterized protein n=1 Tax=Senegalimassilia faecalis TaxID=2509433 RepID=A0A4Q2JXS5_9ACTN|nr:hypothetical protein [Senegalimassilia faecalis]RXZ53855.1 hypothetical protein ET524_04690 [Senegalimassilia faecalis]